MNTELKLAATYKGIEIFVNNTGYYTFVLFGREHINTNIHMAKRMITRTINFQKSLNK